MLSSFKTNPIVHGLLLLLTLLLVQNVFRLSEEKEYISNSYEDLYELMEKTEELESLEKVHDSVSQNLQFYQYNFLNPEKPGLNVLYVMEQIQELARKHGFRTELVQVNRSREESEVFSVNVKGSENQIFEFLKELDRRYPNLDFEEVSVNRENKAQLSCKIQLFAHSQEAR